MKYILEDYETACTGCGACSDICPTQAISMIEDKYGFIYPHINEMLCINCNKCKDICPVISLADLDTSQINVNSFAVLASDEIRYMSSSGGAFFILASMILDNGGYVAGAALQDNLTVRHILISDKDDLFKLQKSKYVQSITGSIYTQIEDLLLENKTVLFTGCPCQAAGLRNYLGQDYENLYIADIICHGVPSQKMLRDSLSEMMKDKVIAGLDFRDKSIGWDCTHLKIYYDDASSRTLSIDESYYEQGLHYNLTLRPSCYNCKFCEFPRPGDISIGDFWGIESYKPKLNDKKGTSLILTNTVKGEQLFSKIRDRFEVVESVPVQYVEKNRIHAAYDSHPGRKYFLSLYPDHDFNQAVQFALQNRYDVGLVGNWSYPNYGSELTYYALYSLLRLWGLSVLIISWPKSATWKPYEKPQLFKNNPYPAYSIAPLVNNRRDLKQFNHNCDTFLLGSDQLLNNNLYNWFDKFMQLDWVNNNKKKIAYAASFGSDYIWGSDDDRAELAYFLQRFDFVSMREDSGINLAQKHYNITADLVLDPVFLIGTDVYRNLFEHTMISTSPEKYLFAYTLNPTKEKAEALLFSAQYLNLSIKAAGDSALEMQNSQNIWGLDIVYGLSVEEWLQYIYNSDFVITDSFHGTCFSIIFQKPFIAISNSERGGSRFTSLLGSLGLESRLLKNEAELLDNVQLFSEKIDYTAVQKKLSVMIEYSLNWLKTALISDAYKQKTFSSYDLSDREFDLIYGRIYDVESKLEKKVQSALEYKHIYWEQMDNLKKEMESSYLSLDQTFQSSLRNLEVDSNNKWNDISDIISHNVQEITKNVDFQRANIEKRISSLTDYQQRITLEQTEEVSFLRQQISGLTNALSQLNSERIAETHAIREQLDICQTQLDVLLHSKSYHIGRLITWLPRTIWSWICRINK